MDDSMSCVMSQSNTIEESGWTIYIDDFTANRKEENFTSTTTSSTNTTYSSSSFTSSSSRPFLGSNSSTSFKKLSLKKRKAIKGGLVLDDELEDTASSPVHSPKVSQFNHIMGMKQKEKNNIGLFEEKNDGSSIQSTTENPKSGASFIGRETNDFTELNKKGLCLVHVSVFTNYLRSIPYQSSICAAHQLCSCERSQT